MEKEGWGWATNVVHDVSPLSQVTILMIPFAKLLQKLTLNYHTITTFPEYEIYHTSAPASGVDEGLRLPLYRVCSVDNARPIVLFDPTQGKEVIPEIL